MAHPELGRKILDQLAADVNEIAMVESAPRQDGRNMTMVLHPTKKPKPTKKDERHAAPAPAAAAAAPAATAAPAADAATTEAGGA
jgi:translation initiation factor IF-3